MIIQAEVSLFALGAADLLPSIYAFVNRLERPGLQLEMGHLSTLITGEMDVVFAAMNDAYATVAGEKRHVLVIKIINQIEIAPETEKSGLA